MADAQRTPTNARLADGISAIAMVMLGIAQFTSFVLLFGRLWVPPVPESVNPDSVTPFGVQLFYLTFPLGLVTFISSALIWFGPSIKEQIPRRQYSALGIAGLALGVFIAVGTVADWWAGETVPPVIAAINSIVAPLRILDIVTGLALAIAGAIRLRTRDSRKWALPGSNR